MKTLPIVLLALFTWSLLDPSAASQAPIGTVLTDEEVHGSLAQPIGVDWLPDGRMIITSRGGEFLVAPAGGTPVAFGMVPGPLLVSELGLYGASVDPGWPQRPYLYAIYTDGNPNFGAAVLRLSLFEVSGDLSDPASTNLSLSGERVLIELPNDDIFHQGGAVRFGPAGYLWVAFGDDSVLPCEAMNPESPLGKVLRLDVSSMPAAHTGSPPPLAALAAPGNPYNGPVSSAVWASGFRNPYTMGIDPLSGHAYVGDVGWFSFEEISLISAPGQNHGWPTREGFSASPPAPWNQNCPAPAGNGPFTDPLHAYGTPGGDSVIVLGAYRNLGGIYDLGPEFEGDVFFTDFFRPTMKRLDWDGTSFSGELDAGPLGGSLVCFMRQGPDGAIYYTSNPFAGTGGSVRRVRRAFPPVEESFGSPGASQSGSPLTLAGQGLPQLGNFGFGLQVQGGLPGGSVFLYLALDASPTPTLPVTPQAVFHLELTSALTFVGSGLSPIPTAFDAGGAAFIPTPLPAELSLRGLRFGLQALALEPAGPVTSNAVRLTLGE